MTATCGLCGNPVDGTASINDVDYCHPDDPYARDCYTVASHILTGLDSAMSRWL